MINKDYIKNADTISKNSFRKIKKLSSEIHKFISDNNYVFNKRNKKTNIFDGFLYKLLYSRKNSGQDKATAKLNSLNFRFFKKEHASRQAFKARDNNLTITFYENMFNCINNFIEKNMPSKAKHGSKEVYAVDGVKNNIRKCLSEDGFVTNKNNESITSLVLGVYNVRSNFPVCLELVNHTNERKAFDDFIKNTNKYVNSIFIFDRGFGDKNLYESLSDKDINYIFRIKENCSYIPKADDEGILIDGSIPVRIVSYKIGETKYHLLTNLFNKIEYPIEILKQLYHDRWSIEEFFKYIKNNFTFSYMNEQTKNSLMKTIYAELIVTRISDFLIALHNRDIKKKSNMIINKTVLIDGLFDEFLFVLCNKCKITLEYLKSFYKNYAVVITTNKGKSVERQCTRPYLKWYTKRYMSKYKSEKKKSKNKNTKQGDNNGKEANEKNKDVNQNEKEVQKQKKVKKPKKNKNINEVNQNNKEQQIQKKIIKRKKVNIITKT